MKKVVSVVLVALMVLGLSITAFADDTKFTVTTNVTEAKGGDSVTLTVAGTGAAAKASAMGVKVVSIDDKALALDGKGEWKVNGAGSGFDENGLAAFLTFAEGGVDISADVFAFAVKVKEDAPVGTTEVKLEFTVDGQKYPVSATVKVVCTAHTYGEWTVGKDTHERVCTVCGEKETAAHAWDEGKVTVEPTPLATGTKVYTCKDCKATKTEELPKTVCTHTFGAWTSVDADKHERVCTVCGEKETAAHAWDEGKVTVEPTTTATGEKVYTCKDCGATKTEVIPMNPPLGDSAATIVFLGILALVAACGVIVVSKKRQNG